MDAVALTPIGQIVRTLKQRKGDLIQEEESLKSKLKQDYERLHELIREAETKTFEQVDLCLLKCLEDIQKMIGKLESMGAEDTLPHGTDMKIVHDLLHAPLSFNPTLEHLKRALSPDPNQSSFFANLQVEESNTSMLIITKLEEKVQKYMLNQEKLLTKIKQIEGKKLAKKCEDSSESISSLRVQRMQEERAILVHKISQMSEKVMQLSAQNSELRSKPTEERIRKKGERVVVERVEAIDEDSLLEDEKHTHRATLDKQQVERDSLQREKMEADLTRLGEIYRAKEREWKSLRVSYEDLEKDYETALKKKMHLEEEMASTKCRLEMVLEEGRINISNLKTMLTMREERIASLEANISELTQRMKALSQENSDIEDCKRANQLLRQANQQLKSKHQTIKRQLQAKTISLNSELANCKECIVQLNKQNQSTGIQLRHLTDLRSREIKELKIKEIELESKERQGEERRKKESGKWKKQIKEKQKVIESLTAEIRCKETSERRVEEVDKKVGMLANESWKWKETAERRQEISQIRFGLLKEKLSGALLGQGIEETDKQVETLGSLAHKNAQIKQLREEVRLLKESKQTRELKELSRRHSSIAGVQSGVTELAFTIMEERLKMEKELLAEKEKYFKEKLEAEETLRKTLESELQKERSVFAEYREGKEGKEGKESKEGKEVRDLRSRVKEEEAKSRRIEGELTRMKIANKKLQSEIEMGQGELKTKRELIAGLKKAVQQKDEEVAAQTTVISAHTQEIQRLRRSLRQLGKKDVSEVRDWKERQVELEEQNGKLKKSLQSSEDRVRSMMRSQKQMMNAAKEGKQISKERSKEWKELKQMGERLSENKEAMWKMKVQIERKEEIISNLKRKTQLISGELQAAKESREKDLKKIKSEAEGADRKIDAARMAIKREETKSCLLALSIKKLLELLFERGGKSNWSKQRSHYKQNTKSTLKNISIVSQAPQSPSRQALQILQISLEDYYGLMENDSLVDNSTEPPNLQYQSPQGQKGKRQEQLLLYIQQLEPLLMDPNVGAIVDYFRQHI